MIYDDREEEEEEEEEHQFRYQVLLQAVHR
jgi:hypothetical protein